MTTGRLGLIGAAIGFVMGFVYKAITDDFAFVDFAGTLGASTDFAFICLIAGGVAGTMRDMFQRK